MVSLAHSRLGREPLSYHPGGGEGRGRRRGGEGEGRGGGRGKGRGKERGERMKGGNRLVSGQGSYEFGSQSDITVHFSLPGCKPELQMMYAGSKNALVSDGGFTKVGYVLTHLRASFPSLLALVHLVGRPLAQGRQDMAACH